MAVLMPRKKRKRPRSDIVGLTRRGERAYYHRRMPEAVGGDRLYVSLEAEWGSDVARTRAQAVGTLWDRGDWPVLRRWARGETHVSELQRAVREGAWDTLKRLNVEGVLLGPAVEEHLTRVEATRAAGTLRNHRAVCTALVDAFGADFPMYSLTTRAAEQFLHAPHVDEEPWAAETQRLYRMVAGALWRFVIDRQAEEAEQKGMLAVLKVNPWRKAQILEPRQSRPQVLTEAELRALMNHPAVRGLPVEALIGIAAYGGLRKAEILNLRMGQDVHLDVKRPYLTVQSREGDYGWTTKTARSERDVRIPPVLVDIIRRHITHFAGVRYLLRGRGRDYPLHHSSADRWTRRALTAAGLHYGRAEGEGLTLHSFRHTHATILLSRGVSIAAVAARLGDTKEVVLHTYSHVLPDDEERALAILEECAR